jgi:hypothetical protein
MTRIDGLSLTEAEHVIEEAHPGFHVWHSDAGHEYATIPESDLGGCGTTLDAPSVERIEEVIGEWEYQHARSVAA